MFNFQVIRSCLISFVVIVEDLQLDLFRINFDTLIRKIRSIKIRISRTARTPGPVRWSCDEQKCPNLNFQILCLYKMGQTGN